MWCFLSLQSGGVQVQTFCAVQEFPLGQRGQGRSDSGRAATPIASRQRVVLRVREDLTPVRRISNETPTSLWASDLVRQPPHLRRCPLFLRGNSRAAGSFPAPLFVKGIQRNFSSFSPIRQRPADCWKPSALAIWPTSTTFPWPFTITARRWEPSVPVMSPWLHVRFCSCSQTALIFPGGQSWPRGTGRCTRTAT
jgi:hypothetical protein